MTFVELWKMDTPSVSVLNIGQKDTLNGEIVFAGLIRSLVKFFGHAWTAEMIADCAKVCFSEWYYLTFAELAHFAQKAKAGGFKQGNSLLYGNFAPAVLIDWLCTYANENLDQRAGYFGAKKPEWQEPENPIDPEYIKLAVSDMAHRFCEGGVNDQIEANKTREMIDQSVKKFKETVTEGQLQKEYEERKKSEITE